MTERTEVLADQEIARRASRGAATYVVRTAAWQAIQAVSALAVARILEPHEYGLFALALTLVAAARTLGDLGITYSMIVRREVSDSDLRIGLAVALAVALVSAAAISLAWTQFGLVQRAGGSAVWIGPAMAATLLISVPTYPSTVLLERQLKFGRLGVIGVIQGVCLFGTQIILLLVGVGLWSMVIAQIVGTVVATCLTVHASGRLILPSLHGPVLRMLRDGLPYGASIWTGSFAGAAMNLLVAAQLGARGVGFFGWCTILATPAVGALAAVHSVAVPTLARMRRDDGRRYEESVGVVMQTMAATAAIAAGCLIGLASPTIRYVFGTRWLPATAAVQFCLGGMIASALLSVLYSDANARQLRGRLLTSAVIGAVAMLASFWPLVNVGGVGGASAAANCVGPAAAVVVLAWGTPSLVTRALWRSMRLFIPLLATSVALGRLVHTLPEFALACALSATAGLLAAYLGEGELVRRVVRVLRAGKPAPLAVVEPVSGG